MDENFNNVNNELPVVKEGNFVRKIYDKQKISYGENAAIKTKDHIKEIFKACEDLVLSNDPNKNVLLVGKVQSGKTSNMQMFSAFAFDNGYQCCIIYGGYDKELLKQTCNRFKKEFDVIDDGSSNYLSESSPEIFATNDDTQSDIENLDENIITKLVEMHKPIFFISMKRPTAMQKIISVLQSIKKFNLKTFIIDDESDQASLNTKVHKDDESATYAKITEMKRILNNPLYLAITATPYANVLLDEKNGLLPNKLFLIHPGDGYTGADFYHLNDDHIILIDSKDLETIDEDKTPPSLYLAIRYFLLASVIMNKRFNNSINYTDMIIHTDRLNVTQNKQYQDINEFIASLQRAIKYGTFDDHISGFKQVYNLKYFSQEIISQYPFDSLVDNLKLVILDTAVVLQNSQGKETQTNLKYRYHKIYIGGDLLQRGLTFPRLITTYFTRSPKITNMDTTIQRARWFGYRANYIDLCKLFTTTEIQKNFSALTQIEEDLWEQCKLIEAEDLKIGEIVIDAENTNLNPTRKNVAAYMKIKMGHKWLCQKQLYFSPRINEQNNKFIKKFLHRFNYQASYVARHNSFLPSCYYTELTNEDVEDLFQHTIKIFNNQPFSIQTLKKYFQENQQKIILEKMFDLDSNLKPRLRSFYKDNNEIYALQQGPDQADLASRKYDGDAKVIVDLNAIIIQIYWIEPMIKNEYKFPEYDQYMFAIHIPQNYDGFVRTNLH